MSEQVPEVIAPPTVEEVPSEAVQSPAKVMRIGAMTKELLEEVRRSPIDEAARARMRDIFETSVKELAEVLSPDLQDELGRLTSPFDDDSQPPTEAELRVAQAQLVGWLEGLFHGIQATLFAQQMQAQAQLQQMRQRGLPPGAPGSAPEGAPGGGQYL